MIQPTSDGGEVESYSFDPNDPEDLKTTMEEVLNFMNAERISRGLPKARSIIVMALDKPYSELGDVTEGEPA